MADAREDNQLRSQTIKAGSFNWINGSEFHRINLINEIECWILFIHRAKVKSLGLLEQIQQRYAFHDQEKTLKQLLESHL